MTAYNLFTPFQIKVRLSLSADNDVVGKSCSYFDYEFVGRDY